jgi:hypothetical protein
MHGCYCNVLHSLHCSDRIGLLVLVLVLVLVLGLCLIEALLITT